MLYSVICRFSAAAQDTALANVSRKLVFGEFLGARTPSSREPRFVCALKVEVRMLVRLPSPDVDQSMCLTRLLDHIYGPDPECSLKSLAIPPDRFDKTSCQMVVR